MPYLGCIADDFTGATDLANNLVRGGLRALQVIGSEAPELDADVLRDLDVIVVALKSRSIPADEAAALSLSALKYLQRYGCRQIYFKYCSTFDSTDAGNIGPVGDALLDALGAQITIHCPSFPATGRTVYQGHLFVGDRLLSESGMQNHPLTPMTDPDLVRVLSRQTKRAVGLIPYSSIKRGAKAVMESREALRAASTSHVIVDTLSDEDLYVLGEAFVDVPLVCGGSGLGVGLAQALIEAGHVPGREDAAALAPVEGLAAVLAGSASTATQGQVAWAKERWPFFQIDSVDLDRDPATVDRAVDWAKERISAGPVLIYATDSPDKVAAAQAKLGREHAGELIERAFARIAVELRAAGIKRLVVAGGETSGAVVDALGVHALRIGPQIDPGVPVTQAVPDGMAIALKSGNFGAVDFFGKALEMMAGETPNA